MQLSDGTTTEAGRLFETAMRPVLQLMLDTEGAEEVFLNGEELWLAVGDEDVALDWDELGKAKPGFSPATITGAMRNAAVFGARQFGGHAPAKPTLTVKVPPRWRVSAMMPPCVDRWQVAIRHLRAKSLTLDDYVTSGIMTANQKAEIEELLDGKKNVIVSGGTRSGKTTLLGAMLGRAARTDRVMVIEDTPELVVEGRDVVQCRVCPEEDLGSLLRQTLRMGPRRIVLGEVRGAEALEMVRAANTGHDGVICTLHSNGAEETIDRLHTLVCEGQPTFPRDGIVRAVDAVVQIAGYGRSRRLSHIWHVPKS